MLPRSPGVVGVLGILVATLVGCAGQTQGTPPCFTIQGSSELRAKDAVTAVGSVTVCADCLGLIESILAEAHRDLDPPHNER